MIINGRSVSKVLYLFNTELCDECDQWMDEDEPFHFVDGDKWCEDCVNQLECEEE
jgi:hypothetical protein